MANRSLDDRAATMLAATVQKWRGHGVSDQAMIAAGSLGVARAIADHEAAPQEMSFELRVVQDVTAEIMKLLAPKPALGISLVAGNFDKQVIARVAKLGRKLAPVRKRYRSELSEYSDIDVDALSPRALAVYDLYAEQREQIVEALDELLKRDETVRAIHRDEDFDFSIHSLELPATDARRWTILVELEESDSIAHVELDGWTVHAVGWTH